MQVMLLSISLVGVLSKTRVLESNRTTLSFLTVSGTEIFGGTLWLL